LYKDFQTIGDEMGLREDLLKARSKSKKRPAKWEGNIPKRFKKMSIYEMKIWVREQLRGGPPGSPKMGHRELKWNELKANIGRKITVGSDPAGRIYRTAGVEEWRRSRGSLAKSASKSLSFDMSKQIEQSKLTEKLDGFFKNIHSEYNRENYNILSEQNKCRKRWEIGKRLTVFIDQEEHLSRDALFKDLDQLAQGLEIRGFTAYRYRYDCKLYFLSKDATEDHPIFSIDKPEFLQYLCEIATANNSGTSYPELSPEETRNARHRFERLLHQCIGDGVFAELDHKELERIVNTEYARLVATNGTLTDLELSKMHEYIQQDNSEEE